MLDWLNLALAYFWLGFVLIAVWDIASRRGVSDGQVVRARCMRPVGNALALMFLPSCFGYCATVVTLERLGQSAWSK